MKFLPLLVFNILAVLSFTTNAHAEMASALVIDNDKNELGLIEAKQGPHGILLHVDLKGLPAGKHGFHIHQTGTCADHNEFKKSGGHIGKGIAQHGFMNDEGYETGDLPNLIVAENGHIEAEFFVVGAQLAGENTKANLNSVILDDDGAAFMIHEYADDHKTQPIGGAGSRIACGVIKEGH